MISESSFDYLMFIIAFFFFHLAVVFLFLCRRSTKIPDDIELALRVGSFNLFVAITIFALMFDRPFIVIVLSNVVSVALYVTIIHLAIKWAAKMAEKHGQND